MAKNEDQIIGTATWPGGSPVATLRVDRTWSVPGQEWMEQGLAQLYSDDYAGPSDGPFGALALTNLARDVNGTVNFIGRPVSPANQGSGPDLKAIGDHLGATLHPED